MLLLACEFVAVAAVIVGKIIRADLLFCTMQRCLAAAIAFIVLISFYTQQAFGKYKISLHFAQCLLF